MKIMLAFVATIIVFCCGIFVGVYDTVVSPIEPERSSGFAAALLRIVGYDVFPPSGSTSIPIVGDQVIHGSDGVVEAQIELKMAQVVRDRFNRASVELTITNHGDRPYKLVGWECFCGDDKGQFGNGAGFLNDLAARATVDATGFCAEPLRGRPYIMDCRISAGLPE